MPRIRSLATALPPNRISQTDARDGYRRIFGESGRLSVFDNAGVDDRYFVHPLGYYATARPCSERNRDWAEQGLLLAERVVRDALDQARLDPADIDQLFFATTTGLATPSLDALLCQRMGFR